MAGNDKVKHETYALKAIITDEMLEDLTIYMPKFVRELPFGERGLYDLSPLSE